MTRKELLHTHVLLNKGRTQKVRLLFDMISGLIVIKKGNDCVTLHFV